MNNRLTRKVAIAGCITFAILYLIMKKSSSSESSCSFHTSRKTSVVSDDGTLYEYDRKTPIIFIGGVPRSGTTLMRAMLDAHDDVRCGEETRVVPRVLQMKAHWMKSQKESMRLKEAGLTGEVLDSAISSFILEVVARHGEPSTRLCNKDPFTLRSGVYLKKLFPNSKFLFMVRDGRATVHSIITRKVTITGFHLDSYRQSLEKWNSVITAMNEQCKELGDEHCMIVHYEQLVLHPRTMMSKILKFLKLDWSEAVLHHEKQINKPHGISLSKLERSSDQVVKPVNLEALSKWVGQIPEDVLKDMDEIAPMLQHFGYDPTANPPNYGRPDSDVVENTNDVKRNAEKWDEQGRLIKSLSKQDS